MDTLAMLHFTALSEMYTLAIRDVPINRLQSAVLPIVGIGRLASNNNQYWRIIGAGRLSADTYYYVFIFRLEY